MRTIYSVAKFLNMKLYNPLFILLLLCFALSPVKTTIGFVIWCVITFASFMMISFGASYIEQALKDRYENG